MSTLSPVPTDVRSRAVAALAQPPALLERVISADTLRGVNKAQALKTSEPPSAISTQSGTALDQRVFDALANAKTFAAMVSMHLDKAWREKLFNQLDDLHDLSEWETGDEPVEQKSFITFLKTFIALDPRRRPSLGMTHDGHILMAWVRGSDRLTLEFLENDSVRWTVTMTIDGNKERAAGQTVATRLTQTLAPYSLQDWLSNDK